jgi:hypothetical protein
MGMLQGLPDLDGTGWSQDDLASLLIKEDEESQEEDEPGAGDIPDDDYQSQLGVIIICQTQKQQQQVFEGLQGLVGGTMTPELSERLQGVELRIVAI